MRKPWRAGDLGSLESRRNTHSPLEAIKEDQEAETMIVPFQNKKNPGGLSPCVGMCVMDEESGWCKGCYRTLDEIKAWQKLTLVE